MTGFVDIQFPRNGHSVSWKLDDLRNEIYIRRNDKFLKIIPFFTGGQHNRKMHITTTALTADLKVMSAVLNKNIRAIAAVVTYDLLTQQDSMKQDDQFKFCFNAFHGNDDSNIISQVDLLLQGHRFYGMLYDIKPPTPVTDRNTEESPDDASVFVLKERYGQSNVRFILGKHFTKSSLSSPTKARLEEKVTGRYIYDC